MVIYIEHYKCVYFDTVPFALTDLFLQPKLFVTFKSRLLTNSEALELSKYNIVQFQE